MPEATYDLLVIGGGIVGLSAAMEATRRFPQLRLAVLEKENEVARHQSGHNSGVIHSGIYYKPGSLKARLCVEGAAAMVEFCRQHSIAYEICGKVIVATSEAELSRLQELHRRGVANGLQGIRELGPEELPNWNHTLPASALSTCRGRESLTIPPCAASMRKS